LWPQPPDWNEVEIAIFIGTWNVKINMSKLQFAKHMATDIAIALEVRIALRLQLHVEVKQIQLQLQS
jgi:hypothetical protein